MLDWGVDVWISVVADDLADLKGIVDWNLEWKVVETCFATESMSDR